MAIAGRRDHQPWSPQIESSPLFVNSADYERRLRHESGASGLEPEDQEFTIPDGEEVSVPSSSPT